MKHGLHSKTKGLLGSTVMLLAASIVGVASSQAGQNLPRSETSLLATPVDLSAWTAESYPAVAGFPAGDWELAPDNLSVTQWNNGQPTVFYSDTLAFGTSLTGEIMALPDGGDDDYIGFVIGFQPGDTANLAADYLLIDWKRVDQFYNFGAPSNTTPGSTAYEGLAVSRVTGIPTADEFWGHVNFVEDGGGGLEELARGTTLGTTGWNRGETYQFEFDFTPTRLRVSVNGIVELNVTGSFANGRLGFYNFSQGRVLYSGFEAGLSDIDGDGILDIDDNCIDAANPDQRDSNGDGFGNACDPDLDNDCAINFSDLGLLKSVFFSDDPDADFDGNGSVSFEDLGVMKFMFFGAPGPTSWPHDCD